MITLRYPPVINSFPFSGSQAAVHGHSEAGQLLGGDARVRVLAAREAQRALPFSVQVDCLTLSIRPALSPISDQLDLRRFSAVLTIFFVWPSPFPMLSYHCLTSFPLPYLTPEIRPIRVTVICSLSFFCNFVLPVFNLGIFRDFTLGSHPLLPRHLFSNWPRFSHSNCLLFSQSELWPSIEKVSPLFVFCCCWSIIYEQIIYHFKILSTYI